MAEPRSDTASPAEGVMPTRKVWVEPEVSELELSRTAINPGAGSDGGTLDCQHF